MIHKCYASEIKDYDDKGRVVIAANAFDNEDSDGDISMKGAFNQSIKSFFHRTKWLYNHDRNLLLGVPLEAVEEYPYLKITGQLNMKKQLSREVYEDYKLYAEHGKTLEHSVGVSVMKRDKEDSRKVLEYKLWEYSTLSFLGSNENTPMLGIKSVDGLLQQLNWADIRLRKGNYSDETFLKIESLYKQLSSLISEPETSAISVPIAKEPEGVSKSTTPTTEPDTGDNAGEELFLALRLLNAKI